MSRTFDIHQQITDSIVAAIENAPDFALPWTRTVGNHMTRPANIASANPYNGVNVLSLRIAAQAHGFPTHLWLTYRHWQDRGAQVRKGEKASLVVVYKRLLIDKNDKTTGETVPGERLHCERLIAKASFVFNTAQVEGSTAEAHIIPDEPLFDPIERAERFTHATGASIAEGGERACFIPATDDIQVPERRRFCGTATTTPAEGYYSTLFNELVHWSGANDRLARDLTCRFGSADYAMEELVAELGAAFFCSELAISPKPRADHAAYIRSWLTVLKSDKRAIFTAASKASEAIRWPRDLDELDATQAA